MRPEARPDVIGIAASGGQRRGRARVLLSPDEFPLLRHGEILVTRFTTPDVVLTFDRAAALVTDQGGRLAHAALVARELGIPAVVGTQSATEAIPDGSVLVVDGTTGTILIAESPSV
jgi:phosphoenolpyruvate synthase/pyruvate phosphate dikinase